MSRHIAFALSALAFAALACSVTFPSLPSIQSMTGSGDVISITEDFTDFQRLQISHAFKTTVQQGDAYSVVVRIDDNLQPYLRVSQSGNLLSIGLKEGVAFLSNATLEADITMPSLTGIEVSGASDASLSGFSSADDLRVEASGASNLAGDIQAGDVFIEASGASTVSLTGGGQDLVLGASGASSVDLEDFPVSNVKAVLSGASKATVDVSGTLDVEASGASHLTYLGDPTLGTMNISGASTVNRK